MDQPRRLKPLPFVYQNVPPHDAVYSPRLFDAYAEVSAERFEGRQGA